MKIIMSILIFFVRHKYEMQYNIFECQTHWKQVSKRRKKRDKKNSKTNTSTIEFRSRILNRLEINIDWFCCCCCSLFDRSNAIYPKINADDKNFISHGEYTLHVCLYVKSTCGTNTKQWKLKHMPSKALSPCRAYHNVCIEHARDYVFTGLISHLIIMNSLRAHTHTHIYIYRVTGIAQRRSANKKIF